jgi:hypothetical protein
MRSVTIGCYLMVAAVSLAFAPSALAQQSPGGAVPYQSNRPQYLTNAPHVGENHALTAPKPNVAGCMPSPAGGATVLNPGTAGPALSSNNNCGRNAAPGTGISGPH